MSHQTSAPIQTIAIQLQHDLETGALVRLPRPGESGKRELRRAIEERLALQPHLFPGYRGASS